ncbi:MAG: hypothetical protein FWH43_07670 [Endomicrobia bacterium]|nr:hypothetical protein [Endomicrobiia bacterium]
MKKLLAFLMFFVFATPVYAETYAYKAKTIDKIDIVISAGTLNITSGKAKDIVIDIKPDKFENALRHAKVDEKGNLQLFFDGEEITGEAVINIAVPSAKNKIKINSANAAVNVSGIKGSLNVEAADGKVNVKKFFGDFKINTAKAEVNAEGGFKKLAVESGADAVILVSLRKIPSLYEYSVVGKGNVTLKIPSTFAKARLKVDKTEFQMALNIE